MRFLLPLLLLLPGLMPAAESAPAPAASYGSAADELALTDYLLAPKKESTLALTGNGYYATNNTKNIDLAHLSHSDYLYNYGSLNLTPAYHLSDTQLDQVTLLDVVLAYSRALSGNQSKNSGASGSYASLYSSSSGRDTQSFSPSIEVNKTWYPQGLQLGADLKASGGLKYSPNANGNNNWSNTYPAYNSESYSNSAEQRYDLEAAFSFGAGRLISTNPAWNIDMLAQDLLSSGQITKPISVEDIQALAHAFADVTPVFSSDYREQHTRQNRALYGFLASHGYLKADPSEAAWKVSEVWDYNSWGWNRLNGSEVTLKLGTGLAAANRYSDGFRQTNDVVSTPAYGEGNFSYYKQEGINLGLHAAWSRPLDLAWQLDLGSDYKWSPFVLDELDSLRVSRNWHDEQLKAGLGWYPSTRHSISLNGVLELQSADVDDLYMDNTLSNYPLLNSRYRHLADSESLTLAYNFSATPATTLYVNATLARNGEVRWGQQRTDKLGAPTAVEQDLIAAHGGDQGYAALISQYLSFGVNYRLF